LNHILYLNLKPIELTTKISTSNFGTKDFRKIITEKIAKILQYVFPENINNPFIISDIDIQVFQSFEHILKQYNNFDIVFQKENRNGGINTGFMLIKNTPTTLNLFKDTLDILMSAPKDKFVNEQDIIQELLCHEKYKIIKGNLFPNEIWAFSNGPMPNIETLILHHANCTSPSENESRLEKKIKQLNYIKNLVNKTFMNFNFC
jgi:hypothetical protein